MGRVDWERPHYPGPNQWGLRDEDGLLAGLLILGIVSIWRAKGIRWFALSMTLLLAWVLFAAEFIAGMSLAGKWL